MSSAVVPVALLAVRGVEAGYGPVQVLRGIDLDVFEREVVVVLGANGAGKTTTLRALSGMIPARGRVSLQHEGNQVELSGRRPDQLVRLGVVHIPQGRGTIVDLTVDENLRVGAYSRRDKEVAADADRWYETFPQLAQRRSQTAGTLSGGEQQMLAVARALMARPRLLLLDEPSLGLAPLVTAELFERLAVVNGETGTAMLLVEQNANLALRLAHRGYVLESGAVVAEGTADELQRDDLIRKAYLGT